MHIIYLMLDRNIYMPEIISRSKDTVADIFSFFDETTPTVCASRQSWDQSAYKRIFRQRHSRKASWSGLTWAW